MVRKISGKTKSPNYTHLNHPIAETKSTSKFDIAETLGEHFLNNSSSRNYSEKFQKVKNEQEKIKLNFKSTNTFLLYVTLCPFLYCNHLDGEERAGCFTFFVFVVSRDG